jgi:hypothetical protein
MNTARDGRAECPISRDGGESHNLVGMSPFPLHRNAASMDPRVRGDDEEGLRMTNINAHPCPPARWHYLGRGPVKACFLPRARRPSRPPTG